MADNVMLNKLREIQRSLKSEQRFIVNVKDAREVFKLLTQAGLSRERVGRKHWYKIYDGSKHVADLLVSMTNGIDDSLAIAFTVPNASTFRTRHEWE